MAALPVILALLLWVSPAFAVTAVFTCGNAAGTTWVNPQDILTNDGTLFAGYTGSAKDFLSVTQCTPDVSVPDGSTVTGIQVRTLSCGTGGTAGSRQFDLNMLNMGVCTGKTGNNMPQCGAFSDQTFGGTTDVWGCPNLTVSTSNVNSTSFGVTVRDNNTTSTELKFEFISITLTFTTTSTTTTTVVGGAPPQRRLL